MSFSTIIAILYVFLGAILFLLGTIIFRENPRARVNRITGLMLFFAGLGPVFGAVGTAISPSTDARYLSSSPLYYNLFYFWELFFPQLIFFASVFPVLHAWYLRWRRLKYAIFIPHIFHIIWVSILARPELEFLDPDKMTGLAKVILSPLGYTLRLASLFFSVLFEFHLKFFSIVNLAYIVIAFWLLMTGYRQLRNPRLRRQVRILLWGIPGAVGLYAVAFILPPLSVWEPPEGIRYGMTIAALIFGAGSIAWSIIRHQFLDVRLIVRQSLVFSISSALLVAVYLLVIIQVSGLIKDTLELDSPLVDIAFIVLILIFFQPVKEQIDDVVTRFFLRDKADYRTIIERYSVEISTVFDPEILKRRMMEVVTGPMYVERAFFAFHDRDSSLALEWDSIDDRPRELPPDDHIYRLLSERDKPVFLDELAEEDSPGPIIPALKDWGCRVIIPIREQDQLSGLLFLSEKVPGFRYSYEDLNLLSVLANQLAAGLTSARLYREAIEKQKIEEELNVARQIQMQLLPQSDPCGLDYEFAAFAQPSRQVGGDYFDYFERPDGQIGLVIADVSGKGVPAALLVSQLQAIFKSEVRTGKDLSAMMATVNQIVTESTSPEKFATLFYADWNPVTRQFNYVNAGHNYPIVVRENGTVEQLSIGGLVLGVIPTAAFERGSVQLAAGDLVLLYTDGLSELNNPEGEEYGEERLIRLLRENAHLSAEAIKTKIIRDATRFSLGELGFDDLTLIVFKVRENDSA